MSKINYVIGDATNPIGDGNKMLCHIVNDSNKWGKGFVMAISKKWKTPEQYYRVMTDRYLGNVQVVQVENNLCVINMVAQHDVRYAEDGTPPIRYDALKKCLEKVNELAYTYFNEPATIHAPRFGAGLAGGDWNVIEKIIEETITVDVTVYDLK